MRLRLLDLCPRGLQLDNNVPLQVRYRIVGWQYLLMIHVTFQDTDAVPVSWGI